MDKIKTIRLKKGAKVTNYRPTKTLADEDFIGRVILECLKNNDPEGVIEAIEAYLDAVNILKFSRETEIPRSTLYYLSKSKNPTLRTLARTVHEIAGSKPKPTSKKPVLRRLRKEKKAKIV